MSKIHITVGHPFVEFNSEQNSIHQIILQSGLLQDIGLYHGKLGLILFFIYYSKIKENTIYEDIANDLLKDVITKVHKELPLGFESGISGIGWGIEYLIQQGFVEGDSLEVCEELDDYIMKQDLRRLSDYSFDTGLGGIMSYILSHIRGVYHQHSAYPFDETYLNDVYIAAQHTQKQNISQETKHVLEQYIRFYQTKMTPDDPVSILSLINNKPIKEKTGNIFLIGLKNGLAGFVLNQYSEKIIRQ